jgi:hypothetical protein
MSRNPISYNVTGNMPSNPTGNGKVCGYYCPVCRKAMPLKRDGMPRARCSSGHKARKVYVTYRPVGDTCDPHCALLDNGCYAQGGRVAPVAKRSAEQSFDLVKRAATLPPGSFVRLDVSGDKVGPDGARYRDSISVAFATRPDVRVWSYTHSWADAPVAEWGASLPANVSIVASLDVPEQETAARAMGWRTVASVTPTADGETFTAEEARAVRALGRFPCPAQIQGVKVGCADVMCCSKPGRHVVFAAHGQSSKRAIRSLAAVRSLPMA